MSIPDGPKKSGQRLSGGKTGPIIWALLLATLPVIPAFGQQSPQAQPSSSSTAQTPTPSHTLPSEVAKEIAGDEPSIHDALTKIDDVSQYDAAIPKAERVLQLRTANQGRTWWETVDAREDLMDLRQLSSMSGDQRANLIVAWKLRDQIATFRSTGKPTQAVELQTQIVSAEEKILGDDSRVYAGDVSLLGQMYEGMDQYEKSEPLLRQAVEIRKRALGEQHPIYAQSLNDLGLLYQTMGRYRDAEELYNQSLNILQQTIGEDQAQYAATLDNLATLTVATGQDKQAEAIYLRAIDIEKKTVGNQSPLYAATLCNLGDLYRYMGLYAQALPIQQESLAIRKSVLGEQHPDYARSLDRLAALYDSMGRYVQAEPLYKQALEIRKNVLGEQHSDYARSLNNLALLYKEMGRYPESEPLFKEALAIRAQVFGVQHRTYASTLDDLAQLDTAMGKYDDAEKLFKQALEIRKNTVGEEHPAYAVNLDNLALLYEEMGRYKEAETLLTQALEIRQKTIGEHHPGYAHNLNDLAQLYQTTGRYDEAEKLYRQALDIQKGTLGEVHSEYATTVDNLASLDVATGRDDEAEALYREALDVERRAVGDQHPMYAATLCNLGDLYRLMGRFSQAEPLQMQSLDIRKKALGEDHPDYARSLDRLAALYDSMGRRQDAEPLYKQALEIRKSVLGEEHPDYARTLNNLALLYKEMGRYSDSEPLYLEALEIRKKVFGEGHRTIASSLDDLAQLYAAMGEYQKAEPLYKQALEIRRKTLGENHPAYAVNLDNLSLLYELMDRYDEAEPMCRQALEIRKKTVGEHHPQYAANMRHLATILAATGRTQEASQLLLQSALLQWQHLTENFPTMSDQQKRQFLSQSRFVQSEELSSLVFEGKGADPRDGFRGALLSKQLLFEVARQESGALLAAVASAPPEWQAKWHERERLRHEYATTAILDMSGSTRPPAAVAADQQRMQNLARRIEALEAELRRGNAAYAAQAPLQMVTLEDVSTGLHAGEVLLEYVEYRPRDFKARKWSDAHYGVFILQGGTGRVTAVDLGSAAGIDDKEQLFRSRMATAISLFGGVEPSMKQVRDSEAAAAEASSALRALIWDPVEKNLTGVKRVYVAPDGMLSLIPFEALAKPDRSGGWRYLIESREFVYLNTGRDLARLTLTAKNRTVQARTAVLVSDPDFDANQTRVATVVAGLAAPSATIVIGRTGQQVPKAQPIATLGASASSQAECQLPAAWAQGPVDYLDQLLTEPARKQLSGLGWTVMMLTHDTAVEEAVLDLQAPRILQFATHGYYLNCSAKAESWDNPLLRSGMVMTGVNTWPKEHTAYFHVGKEILTEEQARSRGLTDEQLQASRVEAADGILTAYEVSGMNLQGTELVNLTACETGLGEVTPDGVAGLRQAFLLAGARALTMSMWEVPAAETGAELNSFYEKWLVLARKGGRAGTRYEAFHSAQLSALKAARAQYGSGHPYYWAGVVFVGDPGDLAANPAVAPHPAPSRAAQ